MGAAGSKGSPALPPHSCARTLTRPTRSAFSRRCSARIAQAKWCWRAATSPATIAGTNWAGPLAHATVSQTVIEMATASAAAALVAAGMKLSFDHFATIHAPGRLVDASDAGTWVAEGAPVSVRVQRITSGTTLSPSKLVVVNAASREQIESSNIEQVAHALLIDSGKWNPTPPESESDRSQQW